MIDHIFKCIKDLKCKIKNVVKRAYVSNTNDDSGSYPLTQASYGSPTKTADVERISPYGLYVNFPAEIQLALFSFIGDEANRGGIAYSQDDRFKNLNPGEVLLGNPGAETFIKLDNEGNIDITSKAKMTINVTGDVDLNAVNVNVNATKVNLGSGGNNIARLGDAVVVSLTTGIGTITSAGVNTSL